MSGMFKRIDKSSTISRLIAAFSEFLSQRRGAPVVLGIVISLVGFTFQLINLMNPSPLANIIGIVGQNLGTLIALIGLLISDALGK